jgi:hypothetical protein
VLDEPLQGVRSVAQDPHPIPELEAMLRHGCSLSMPWYHITGWHHTTRRSRVRHG